MDKIEDFPKWNSTFARTRAAVTRGRRNALRHDLGTIDRMSLVVVGFTAVRTNHVPREVYSCTRLAQLDRELFFHSGRLARQASALDTTHAPSD
jgi:hypothetical protein